LHGEIAAAAAKTGKSLNQWVADTLNQVIHAH
jgi:predicted HicB family RNase H-like nuclease